MIQSLERGILILEILESQKACGVTEIAKKLDINKSSAFRLLQTLEAKNLVEKDEQNKYKLGTRFLQFANHVLEGMELTKIAKPYLDELVRLTQETAHLCILSNGKALFIDQKRSSEIVSVNTRTGGQEPLHCSAVGKVLLAFLKPDKLEEMLDSIEFTQYTPRTITSRPVLIAQLEKIRELGYAVDDEEINVGVRCIAAPIRDYTDSVIASIGVSGPASRVQFDSIDEYANSVKLVADKISIKMGHVKAK